MSELNTDSKTYLARLQATQDARMARANDLVSAAAERDKARAHLDAADTAYATEYRAALDAGWSDKELRNAGLPAPVATTARRPAAKRTRTSPAPRETAPAVESATPQEATPLTS